VSATPTEVAVASLLCNASGGSLTDGALEALTILFEIEPEEARKFIEMNGSSPAAARAMIDKYPVRRGGP